MKKLMKGNEALAAAAIHAGVKCFFGYPITPQTEIAEYMARHLPEAGGVFLQAESEVAAINMVYGAAGAGFRAMTSSSSPGISLKQEGISYIAGADLPCVIVNVMRAGPGLGGIQASQSDYFQAVKGGGHGDYRMIVLAPSSVWEMAQMTAEAFELADRQRMPVMILSDGMTGQMMEPVDLSLLPEPELSPKPWAANGRGKRETHNIINSLYLTPEELEEVNLKRRQRYMAAEDELQDWEEFLTEDAEIVVAAYGIAARISKAAVTAARSEGIRAGLIRPKKLWPFPKKVFANCPGKILCVELSMGQMIEDVRLAAEGAKVKFYGRCGGMCVEESGILEELRRMRE